MGFFGRLPRLGYLLRLCIISIFYALGGLLVHLALPGEGTSLLGLICLFLGSGFVLLALLLWWFATVRRFHDMNLSGSPRREDRCGSHRKEQTAFQDIRCRCCVRMHPFHNDGLRHFGAAFLAPVQSRMTKTEAVSVCAPYQWQLCLPQPWSPQV